MPKGTATDLSLVDTETLITELSKRHEEIIIISECRKKPECVNIFTKTANGEFFDEKVGFDIFLVLQLLHTAEDQMIRDYLGPKKAEDDGSDENNT